jgi:hypothetical protein
MPGSCIKQRKIAVERGKTGVEWRFGAGSLVGYATPKMCQFWTQRVPRIMHARGHGHDRIIYSPSAELIVERGTKHCSDKMREVRCTFIQLQITYDAVVGKIFCYTAFGNAEMLCEARLDGFSATASGSTQKTADGDAQSLARFNVVVSGKIGIAKKERAGSDGGAVSFAEPKRRATQQAAKLHFQERESRRKARIAVATTQRRCSFCRWL